MKVFTRSAIALALAGAVTASAATPTLARSWKPWAAAGAGFVAGAAVGSALAAPRYYGGYGYGGGYGYAPGYDSYAYAPGYDAYAYSPTVTYAPAFSYRYGGYGTKCVAEGPYGKPDFC